MVENLAENAQYSTESVRTKDTVRIGLASDDAFCFSIRIIWNCFAGDGSGTDSFFSSLR